MNGRIGLGIIGEKFNCSVVKSIFKVEEGYRVRHVDWDNYSYGNGLDLRVFKRNKQVMAIEVKNWREMGRPYGPVYAEEQILDRFKNYAGGLKVLIISLLCLLTKRAIELLEAHNIHIIEIGKLIDSKDFPRRKSKTRKGRYSKAFHSVRSKLLKLWSDYKQHSQQARPKVCGCVSGVSQIKLDSYPYVHTNAHNNNHTNSNSKQHDTDTKKTTSIYAYRLLKRAFKLCELRRKHSHYGHS